MILWVAVNSAPARELTLDDLFPTDRVLDVQITVDEKDWDTIRHQSRDFVSALRESRKVKPPESPYTYVDASVTIDGAEFPRVGLRKKGFLGSLSTSRPSLKIKLNHTDKKVEIDGLTNLTLNNNQQDVSLVSQFMGYALFNAAGSPAPRCAYARVTVNGVNLGVYSHVETIRKSFLKRAFGNDKGTLYEGTVVDFFEGWEGSFERKRGKGKPGREKIRQLIKVLERDDENIEEAIGELVDLDSFYTFWALEGLLGFWDGYSGDNNNFLIYLNPNTDKFHFIPWGADSLFTRFSRLPHQYDPRAPISVKTQGLIAHKLYQLKSGRERYARTIMDIIENHWNEEELLAEMDRIEAMVKPHLIPSQRGGFAGSLKATRKFIRLRRKDIIKETANGMPEWKKVPDELFVIGADAELRSATAYGDTKAVEKLLAKGADTNSKDEYGGTPLHGAAFFGQAEVAELLIQKGADINAKNNDGATPMDVLALDWETTKFVAALLRMELDEEEVKAGRAKIGVLLRQHGGETGLKVSAPEKDIWLAARTGNMEAVKQHLANGVDANTRNNQGSTLLSWATVLGQTRIAELLIQKGADVNARNGDGSTPLHGAVLFGETETVRLLIQKGADVNARNNQGATPLDTTKADWGITEFVATLLGVKLDKEKVKTGRIKIAGILRQHDANDDK
jgi:ankyrin repeat protein/spore coat protein CotH